MTPNSLDSLYLCLVECQFCIDCVSPEKTEAYRPPQARGANYTPTAKLHEYEPASNIRQAQAAAGKNTTGKQLSQCSPLLTLSPLLPKKKQVTAYMFHILALAHTCMLGHTHKCALMDAYTLKPSFIKAHSLSVSHTDACTHAHTHMHSQHTHTHLSLIHI